MTDITQDELSKITEMVYDISWKYKEAGMSAMRQLIMKEIYQNPAWLKVIRARRLLEEKENFKYATVEEVMALAKKHSHYSKIISNKVHGEDRYTDYFFFMSVDGGWPEQLAYILNKKGWFIFESFLDENKIKMVSFMRGDKIENQLFLKPEDLQ